MPLVERLNTCCDISDTFVHYDPVIFPRQPSWFCLLEEHVLPPDSGVQIYRVTENSGAGSAMLAMLREPPGLLGVKRLSALQNFYTPDYRPLCTSGAAVASISTLVTRTLADESPDIVRLLPLDAESTETQELRKALIQGGFALNSHPCLVNWFHDVEGNYLQYIANRPKRVQNTLKRRARKLNTARDVNIEIYDGSKDLSRLLDWYETVYSRSWKVPEPYPHFIPALIANCAALRQLRLGFVFVAGRPIAMHFWIVCDGCAFIYKLAHDKAFDKLSPGTVLMAEMLRQVIDVDGVKRIDFLTGDDAYKRDWMSQRRVKIELRAYNKRTLRGIAALMVERYIKPFVKQLRNRVCGALGGQRSAVD